MNRLEIVQFNCGHSNARASRALFDSFERPQVIAVQEPGFNRYTGSTYCPKPYELAYEADQSTRVCFMVRRDVGAAQWKRKQYGPNVASLELNTKRGKISIVNVYNPRDRGPRLHEWSRIEAAIKDAQGEVLLLGDFNAHHQRWGGRGVTCEQNAQHLLDETERWDLSLVTPQGEPTWRRGHQNSVIDLAFASQGVRERIYFCGPEERWALPQDHIPVRITMDIQQARDAQVASRRFALQKLDRDGLVVALQAQNWQQAPDPLGSLHQALRDCLPRHCPRARPSPRARPAWSPKASQLLAGARRARREYTTHGQQADRDDYRDLSNQLKSEIKRVSRANWRRLVHDLTGSPEVPHNKGLWKLSRWSRCIAGKTHEDPHIPALRRRPEDPGTIDDAERARILAEKFFPQPPQEWRREVAREALANTTQDGGWHVTSDEVTAVLLALPNDKTPGPDGIPNEVLKALAPEIVEGLAQGISVRLASGTLPDSLKESTTIALRKEGKKDYSLPSSYRPIALENTLAKVVEKVLANRLSLLAESQELLSWNQMGARKDRSTLSAIGLITSCVETAWRARPGCVASMLSLDLAGAFDNVPHERLIAILREKRIPPWLVESIASFMQGRRTRIAYTGYQSDWIHTRAGIPQGSPLSPILFLFFISDLLERFQDAREGTLGIGFVDDTNLVTWGPSARENCQKLTIAHEQCLAWAAENGARFAPDKYQLIHFTRRRRHDSEDLASTVRVGDHKVEIQNQAIRVLGVWLDPSLTWREHVARATRKGTVASEALARLATSTWGPSARHTRLLYTAIVRPTLLYGAQEWGVRGNGDQLASTLLAPLQKVQNESLRRVTGAYKRSPRMALERETGTLPLDIHIRVAGYQRAHRVRAHAVEKQIAKAVDEVWVNMRGGRQARIRPLTSRERLASQAVKTVVEMQEWGEATRPRQRHRIRTHTSHRGRGGATGPRARQSDTTLLRQWAELTWQKRWDGAAARLPRTRRTAVWTTPWSQDPRVLYAGLSKAEATALFLMRTEVIGLNAWLASIQVPGIRAACPCGWRAQTVRHIVLHCPQYDRRDLLRRCGTERMEEILSRPACAKHAARWLVRSGAMEQFRVAAEIEAEEIGGYLAFKGAEWW